MPRRSPRRRSAGTRRGERIRSIREHELLLGVVVLVDDVVDARRRHRRDEPTHGIDSVERVTQHGELLVELGGVVDDRTGAVPPGRLACGVVDEAVGGESEELAEKVIGADARRIDACGRPWDPLGETGREVLCQHGGLGRPGTFRTSTPHGNPAVEIRDPVRLAEFAVVDDVYAAGDLVPHHFIDRVLHLTGGRHRGRTRVRGPAPRGLLSTPVVATSCRRASSVFGPRPLPPFQACSVRRSSARPGITSRGVRPARRLGCIRPR